MAKTHPLKSRKFWFGAIGAALPVAVQALTAGLGWQAAVGLSTAAIVTYIAVQGQVDKETAKALGDAAQLGTDKVLDQLSKS